MHWSYLIIPSAVLVLAGAFRPVVTLTSGDRHRTGRRTAGDHPSGPPGVTVLGADRPQTCIVCGGPVTDEETHWKAIHHVPA
jgi:hypothetical protein